MLCPAFPSVVTGWRLRVRVDELGTGLRVWCVGRGVWGWVEGVVESRAVRGVEADKAPDIVPHR